VTDPAFETAVIAIVADTFSIDPATVGRHTTADDVEGWDSLGHSVLLARLGQKLRIEIGEQIAVEPKNVGELVDRLAHERARVSDD
jgi:acyl carrier protein